MYQRVISVVYSMACRTRGIQILKKEKILLFYCIACLLSDLLQYVLSMGKEVTIIAIRINLQSLWSVSYLHVNVTVYYPKADVCTLSSKTCCSSLALIW